MTDDTLLFPFKFPVTDMCSLIFASKGEQVAKAMLYVNDVLISVIVPDTYVDVDTPVAINFFDGSRFHRGLLSDCKVEVVLYTENGGIPSLMTGCCDNEVIWERLSINGIRVYQEPVSVSTQTGFKKMQIVYMPDRCGFV